MLRRWLILGLLIGCVGLTATGCFETTRQHAANLRDYIDVIFLDGDDIGKDVR